MKLVYCFDIFFVKINRKILYYLLSIKDPSLLKILVIFNKSIAIVEVIMHRENHQVFRIGRKNEKKLLI